MIYFTQIGCKLCLISPIHSMPAAVDSSLSGRICNCVNSSMTGPVKESEIVRIRLLSVWFHPRKVKVKVAQSCPTLCDPVDYTVHGILQARILEWVAFPFSRGSSQSRNWTHVSHIAGTFFTSWATWEAYTVVGILTYLISRAYSWLRNQTRVSCIAGRFFTNWAIREAPIWGRRTHYLQTIDCV